MKLELRYRILHKHNRAGTIVENDAGCQSRGNRAGRIVPARSGTYGVNLRYRALGITLYIGSPNLFCGSNTR